MTTETDSAPGSLFTIEPASWRDLNAVRNLEKVCFPKDAWPLWDVIGVLTLPNIVRLKAVAGEELVGFIAGDVRNSEKLAWIATIGVLPKHRRRGIGGALLEACEREIPVPVVRLSVRASNVAAIRLYEGYAYRRVSVWPHYYSGGEDAVIMEKHL